jgi:hypothetical protein
MKMKRPTLKASLLLALSATSGLAAGFGLRALRQAHPGTLTPAKSEIRTVSPHPPQSSKTRPSALATTVESDLSLSSGVTRWLVWMTAVEKASLDDFPHLARLAKDIPGAVRMLGARWIELNPQKLFDACLHAEADGPGFPAGELAQLLFTEWPKTDPDGVIAALSGTDIPQGWRFTALSALFDNVPERALIAMSDWHVENYGPNMKGVAAWAAADPRHAAEVALAHPAGFATQLVLEKIGREWSQRDPEAALAFTSSQTGSRARELAAHVMRGWVERDLNEAAAWLGTADPATHDRLLPAFVETWGKKDAAAALEWCQTNATGSLQSDVMCALVKGTIERSLDEAAAMVAGLDPSPARTRAASTFAQAALNKGWFPGMMSSQKPTAKPEAIAWLGQLDPAARKEVISSIQWSWAYVDPRGFAAFLRSPAGQGAGSDAMSTAARSLARDHPIEALEWAGELPPKSRDAALTDTFSAWLGYQPDTAMRWLQQLPSDDSRREALYLSAVLNAAPTAGLDTPLGSPQDLARLLATDPAKARLTLSQMPMPAEARSRLLARLGLAEK